MDKSEKLQNIVREQRNEIRSLKYENEVKEDKNLELRSRIRLTAVG